MAPIIVVLLLRRRALMDGARPHRGLRTMTRDKKKAPHYRGSPGTVQGGG
jgi:hypothetical protein